MAINLNTLERLYNLKDKLSNLDIIFIGDLSPSFDKIPNYLAKKLNIDPSLQKNHKHKTENIIKILKNMGFHNISFLDNFEAKNIDYTIDLSIQKSTDVINRKFGIVIDNGTSIYATNIFNALDNIISILDNNGYLLTGIDPMSFNRFPFMPSPENLIDYMLMRKLNCINCNLGIYKNDFEITEKNYPINFRLKHYPIYKSLNALEFYHYLKYIFIDFLFSKKISKDIELTEFKELKLNKFKKFKNEDIKINKRFIILRKISKKLKLFNFLKKIYTIASKLKTYKGRVEISFVFKKDNSIPDNKIMSSTLHYQIRYNF